MGEADGAGLQYLGMTHKDTIQFHRVDIIPAGNNHVFFTINNSKIAIIIKLTDVSGKKPAIFENFCSFFGFLIVSHHYLGALDGHFSRLANFKFSVRVINCNNFDICIRDRHTDGPGLYLTSPGGYRNHSGCFGRTVNLTHHCAG